jgi:hypothetical protein
VATKKLYEVIVTRPATESTVIRVEADSPEEANEEALRRARGSQGAAFNWELNEDNYNDPDEVYIGDEEGTEEVEPDEPKHENDPGSR